MDKKTGAAPAGNSGEAGFDDPNSQISMRLRELYSSVEAEGIPDRFLDLLEKLDEAEKASGHEQ
ncbi:MAG: hypothetical protein C0606_05985 [Hyphomicrobiales bacterium]|nr:MAG: hypothetical protein C0606_05985 [Hyphomicrobiales bacterium]